jgi:putative ABC transport system substrate-binding protein
VGFLASRDLAGPVDVAVRKPAQQVDISLVGTLLEGTIQQTEYRRVLELMRAEALLVGSESEHITYSRLIIQLAEESRLPALFPYRFFAEQGGLITYGTDIVDEYWRSADYIARILPGAKPSELPIDRATKIELVINLSTAKTHGLTALQIVLAAADEIIE